MKASAFILVIRAFASVLGIAAIAIGAAAFRPRVEAAASTPVVAMHSESVSSIPDSIRDATGASVVSHDPFRRNRVPSAVSYDGIRLEAAKLAPPAPPAPKPQLALVGILWGSAPAALIDGVPGIEGSHLFHPGDTAGGVRLKSLTRDRAVVAGLDTAWTLTIRRPAP